MRRGDCADVACPKKGEVCTPENAPRFAWFSRLNSCAYNSNLYFFVAPIPIDGGAAPSPPPIRTILTCGPAAACCSGPKSFPQLNLEPISQRPAPRALFRPKPNGRSLMTVSPLLSNPVVTL